MFIGCLFFCSKELVFLLIMLLEYFYVLDFEAQCTETNEFQGHEMEIIEFPIVIVDIKQNKIVDEFHKYVRPVNYPILTDFCKSLTNIKQSQVDAADEFSVVMEQANEFIGKYPNGRFVTCGNWDLKNALPNQMEISKMNLYKFNPAFRSWINIKSEFKNFYGKESKDATHLAGSIKKMLGSLGMKFEGSLHSGIDDTRNITRILRQMITDGYSIAAC